jgi:GT2 family glycosyltransferase
LHDLDTRSLRALPFLGVFMLSPSAPDTLTDIAPSDLALVVNSYNRRVLLERALRSVYDCVHPAPGEVVVVDDGSTDGSAELVEDWMGSGRYPGLALVRPDHKVAFAGGVNLGIRSCRAPYVCLFETDNVALDSGLWAGVAYLRRHARVAGVGFRVTTMDGTTAGNSMSFPSRLAFVLGQQLSARLGLEAPGSGPRRDVVFTSPLVLSRAALADVGLMDETDFPYCDSDIDWCQRIHDAGFELHVIEDVSVVHDQGGHRSEFSRRRTLDFHRARLAYFRKHGPPLAVPFIRAGLLARHLVELAVLKVGHTAGVVDGDRLATRLELLRRWPRNYESGSH